jgi:peptidoglycan/xylan/chitin deacetylase (PgdA/CDA1 family)
MLIVSNYHYIRENFNSKYKSIFGVTPEQFEKQLLKLSEYGTFISQQELSKFQNKSLDKNNILITFDDGLKEQFELAKPILNKLGIPFVFFINSSNYVDKKVSMVHKVHLIRSVLSTKEILDTLYNTLLDRLTEKEIKLAQINYVYDSKDTAVLKYLLNFKLDFDSKERIVNKIFNSHFNESSVLKDLYLSKEQLFELNNEGSLGSHSHNHYPLGTLDSKLIDFDIKQSQLFFENVLRKKAISISYPYGSHEACDGVTDIARSHGFELGFYMERAANKTLLKNPLMISRFDCNDLPGGKSNIFGSEDLFEKASISKWYK